MKNTLKPSNTNPADQSIRDTKYSIYPSGIWTFQVRNPPGTPDTKVRVRLSRTTECEAYRYAWKLAESNLATDDPSPVSLHLTTFENEEL